MQKYSDKEINMLGLQIGISIKLARLKNNISQEDLGLIIGSNSTQIGRIERFETSTNWQSLLKICQAIDLDYRYIFKLKHLDEILLMIEQCMSLEKKLTQDKRNYYKSLQEIIQKGFKNS